MSKQQLLIALILLAGSFISLVLTQLKRRRLRGLRLREDFGQPPNPALFDADTLPHIKEYWRVMRAEDHAQSQVDDITWGDLDMDHLFISINKAMSNAGEAVLYAMLRETDASEETLRRRDAWMRALTQEAEARAALQTRLRKLGTSHHHSAYYFLRNPSDKAPKHAWVYLLLGVMPLVFLALGFVHPAFFLGIAASFAVNLFIFYRTNAIWETEVQAIRHLASVLHTGRGLLKHPVPGMEEGFARLGKLCGALAPIRRWNALFAMTKVNSADFMTDYLRIAFMLDMICLTRLAAFITRHLWEVKELYQLVGEMDALISLASLRASLPHYCVPVFHKEQTVRAVDIAHPLLTNPVLNSVDWTRNLLITGSNASGKSTFIKAVALNAILAQTIATCYASAFTLPRAQVMSSMAVRDIILEGESYFVVEIKSLRRILTATSKNRFLLCFIDEILRGTNTIERIASSAALLSYLTSQPVLCMAATHDIELTQLLSDYQQFHFREEMGPAGMTFPYRLMEGPSTTRNAIRLLEQMKFPDQVTSRADSLAAHFTDTGSWENHLNVPQAEENK
ncbi:MAG: hypothetical protein GXZ04_00900 [Clostridiales bacterium]|nr:hypothetical protein [Clostridiales bacterium]